jgi:hypothetical protein
VLQKALSPDQYTMQSPASSQLTLANPRHPLGPWLARSGRVSPQKFTKSILRWWWWWLLLLNQRVQLQMVESLVYSLHELILSGYELLYLRVVGGVVSLAVAGLAIA